MKFPVYGGPLDGGFVWRPFMRCEGPTNLNGDNVNYLFTRGGVDHWYCKGNYNGHHHLVHFASGAMPADWASRDKTPEKVGG